MFKCSNNMLPNVIIKLYVKNNKIHSHFTRNSMGCTSSIVNIHGCYIVVNVSLLYYSLYVIIDICGDSLSTSDMLYGYKNNDSTILCVL